MPEALMLLNQEGNRASKASRKEKRQREFPSHGTRLTAEYLLDEVRREFEKFVETASYLDLYVLYEVLNYHCNYHIPFNQDEGVLGAGFMDILGLEPPAKQTVKGGLK